MNEGSATNRPPYTQQNIAGLHAPTAEKLEVGGSNVVHPRELHDAAFEVTCVDKGDTTRNAVLL